MAKRRKNSMLSNQPVIFEKSISSSLFGEFGDFGWMAREDPTDKLFTLYTTIKYLRGIVAIPFRGLVKVNWATAEAPYEGVTMTDRTPREIQLNPRLIMKPPKGGEGTVLDVVTAVALHEAGHACHTPANFADAVRHAQDPYTRPPGKRSVPDGFMMRFVNWTEDLYVQHKIRSRFPGFASYFVTAWAFFLDAKAKEALATASDPLTRTLRNPATLVEAYLQISILLVHRPGKYDAEIYAIDPRFEEMRDLIWKAEKQEDVFLRALYAADAARVFLAIIDYPDDADHGQAADQQRNQVASGEARTDEQLGDTQMPNQARQVAQKHGAPGLPSQQDLAEVADRNLDIIDAHQQAAPMDTSTREGRSRAYRLTKKVQIMDSKLADRDASAAAALLLEHGVIAREMRRRLKFRDRVSYREEGQQRHGVLLDEPNLATANITRQPFAHTVINQAGGVELILLIDESSSMAAHDNWKRTQVAAVCLEYATRGLNSVHFKVFGYTDGALGNDGVTQLFRHFDARLPRLKAPARLGAIRPQSGTPTAGAFIGLRSELRKERRKPGVLPIIIHASDGAANEGTEAVAVEVARLRKEGYGFAHLQIGPLEYGVTRETLNRCYGTQWQAITEVQALPKAIMQLGMSYLVPLS